MAKHEDTTDEWMKRLGLSDDKPKERPRERDDNKDSASEQSKPSPEPKPEATESVIDKRSTGETGKGTPYDPKASERARRWQIENRERYNESKAAYMREYRRKR